MTLCPAYASELREAAGLAPKMTRGGAPGFCLLDSYPADTFGPRYVVVSGRSRTSNVRLCFAKLDASHTSRRVAPRCSNEGSTIPGVSRLLQWLWRRRTVGTLLLIATLGLSVGLAVVQGGTTPASVGMD